MTSTRTRDLTGQMPLFHYEAGGYAALAGLVPAFVNDSEGCPDPAAISAAVADDGDVHRPPVGLVCVENTHNRAGGLAVPPEIFCRTAAAAHEAGLPVHLDGARLFNAAVKWSVPATAYSDCVDSVQICLSKGLGAPVGSLLCGDAAFIDAARRQRKCVGGGMRQAGFLAAAGLHALRHHRERLAEDHENADTLASRLRDTACQVEENPWRTNMVFLRPAGGSAASRRLAASCVAAGVRFNVLGDRVRLVTHLDVSARQIHRAADVIAEALG